MIKDKRVCISMLARDCYLALKKNIPKFDYLLSLFSDNSVIQVVENDSVDGTKELLSEWHKNNNSLIILSEDTNQMTYDPSQQAGAFSRNVKMANFRNKYLDIIKKEKFDYLIVIDADLDDFNVITIQESIENAPEKWSALFANGRYFCNFLGRKIPLKYYDLFAYVPSKMNFLSKNMSFNWELTYKEMALFSDYLNYRQRKLPDYISCSSAFGGIGIYNLDKYKNQQYSTKKNDRSNYFGAVCEHIFFNKVFAEMGGMYICKRIKVLYEQERIFKLFTFLICTKFKFFILEKVFHKRVAQ